MPKLKEKDEEEKVRLCVTLGQSEGWGKRDEKRNRERACAFESLCAGMAVRSSGGWAFAPARPHQREGRSHPFCISPLLCLINWVPNTPVEYIMCPPHLQTPRPHPPTPPPLPPVFLHHRHPPPHPHLLPNLIALLLLFPPPTPFSLSHLHLPPSPHLRPSLILIPLYLSPSLCALAISKTH